MSEKPQSIAALLGAEADGVFRFVPGPPPGALVIPNARVTMIPTSKARDKAAFMSASAQALAFPSYFGQNWDAFYDCIVDLQQPGPVSVLIFDDLSGFARTEPEEFDAALGALSDAAAFWREHGRRLIVLVGLSEPLLEPQLPAVSFR